MSSPWWILALVLAFAGGIALGEWDGRARNEARCVAKLEKIQADAEQARAAALADARTKETARFRNMEVAYRANELENHRLRAAALAADRAARGLRDDLAAIRASLPRDADPACHAALTACHAVLGECSERYRVVALAADDHAADARLCLDGWPK